MSDYKALLHRNPVRPAEPLDVLAANYAAAAARQEPADVTFAALVVMLRGVLANLAAEYGAEVGEELEPADVVDALRAAVSYALTRGPALAKREIAGRIRGTLQGLYRKRQARGAGVTESYDDEAAPAEAPDLDGQQDAARAVEKIRPEDRALLFAAAAYGYDHNELARALGVTPGRARVKLTEARERARKALGDTHNT